MESSKFTGKREKIKAKWTRVTKNCLKVKDPKLARVLIVQNNVYAAVHGVIGEDRLQEACSFLLFPVNVFRPKFAAAELPTNLRNVQLAFFSALFLLVGSGLKRSMPIEKLGSSSLVSSIFQREGRLHCSLTGRKLWSKVKKMPTSSYLRTAQ